MKRFKLFLAILALTLFNSFFAMAQNNPLEDEAVKKPIYIGPVIGYNRVFHSVDLTTYNPSVNCPVFHNGDNNGFFAGGSFELLLGNIKDSKSSLIFRLLYNAFPASMSQSSNDPNGLPSIDQNGNPVNSDVIHTNEIKFNVLTAEVMYKFNFLGNLGVVVGPSVDFVSLTKTKFQKMSLITPAGASFKMTTDPIELARIKYTDFILGNQNPRGIILDDSKIEGGMRVALKAGLQYEIITKSSMYIVPSICYNMGISTISKNETWTVSAIQLGVDIRFAVK